MPKLGILLNGAPDTIRTCDRWYRKPVLYPAELRAHTISIKEDGIISLLTYIRINLVLDF